MPNLAPLPPGSRIEILETAEGLELRTPPIPQSRLGRAGWMLFAVAAGCLAAGGALFLATGLAYALGFLFEGLAGIFPALFLGCTLLLSLIWFGFGIGGFQTALDKLRGGGERIVLSGERIEFDLGAHGAFIGMTPIYVDAPNPGDPETISAGKWPRGEIESIVCCDSVHGRKVCLRRGDERTLLGWKLDEAELEWLRDLLLAWQEERLFP